MANFDKKWSQLSKEESKAMKKKYGSRDAWQKAKSKAQTHQSGSTNSQKPKGPAQATGTKPMPVTDANSKANTMEGVVKDKNGRIVGYTGAAATQRNAERAEARRQANIANYGADGKGYHPETGKNQSGYTRQQQAKVDRQNEAEAYRQSRLDLKKMREQTGSTVERKVDQSAHYKHLMDTKGGYGGSQAHQNAVSQLMKTGQKFSALDVQREMGSNSTHNLDGLYKSYGGIENYMDNHSVGSGNFKGDETLGTMKEADDSQRKYFQDRVNYYNSDSFNEKYGSYDWAQRDKQRMNEQAQDFYDSFDAREKRMNESGYGHVYGY